MTDACAVCVQNTDSKVKLGIFLCLGCKQMFCTQHVAFHRQELANELDLVTGKRNELQEVLDHRPNLTDVSIQLNLIDEWVKKTVEQVHQVADNVRQRVLHLADEQKTSVKDQFAELSKQLDTLRENENFYEKDIENLKAKCIQLKNRLNPVDINVIVTDVSSFLNQAVTLQQTEEKPVETIPPMKTLPLVEPLSFVENLVKHQKPFKMIKIPHTGVVHMGMNVALLRSGGDFTIIDLDTDSLHSTCMENSWPVIFCWSAYLDGFLCADPRRSTRIGLLKIEGRNLEKQCEFDGTIKKISCMICVGDRMMLVCYGTQRNNDVEERSMTAPDLQNNFTGTIKLINRWRSPLTCASDEIIDNISFDDQRIVLLIARAGYKTSRVEFRTRNMHVIGQLELNDYYPKFSSILYRLNDGWLLGDKKSLNRPWHFTLIDDNLKQREQKILSTSGIINIELIHPFRPTTCIAQQTVASYNNTRAESAKYSSNKSVLAIYRENGCVDTLKHDRLQLFLDLYEI